MAVTYGFYDSLDGDRRYNAEQFGSLFQGIIVDGVFKSVGNKFAVTPASGLTVNVASGRAWFNNTWTYNDNVLQLTCAAASPIYKRIDTVVIEVDKSVSSRENTIKIVQGVPAENPVAPTLIQTGGVYQYPLANITINAGATTLTAASITTRVGTTACPYVTAPLESISMEAYVEQWETEWNEATAELTAEFNNWFQNLEAELDEDVAANLAAEIAIHPTTIALYESMGWVSSE